MNGRSAPPGRTEEVVARSVLVLAPHYDDEVLGCGGLMAQLVRRGAVVRILFLTDGSGGCETAADSAAYARGRREESVRAGAVLGLAGAEHLEIRDGELVHSIAEVAPAIHRALLAQRPDLLLAPSPLEVSPDHRAAFLALHRVLSPVRGDSDLVAVANGLRVLLYEVNHPAYPDLLVDVSSETARIEEAMACYQSQEARHAYLAAALGLRRYRALSLAPGPTAVEGYRQLSPRDFVTASAERLTERLGGQPVISEVREGPFISVVVRTKDRPALLAEALASLARGSYRRVQVVLVNDGGTPPPIPADYPFPVARVDLAPNRGRAEALNAGVAAASGDYLAFLDDDDLYEPAHLVTLAGLVSAAGVRVAYTDAAVGIYELDGEEGWRCVERRLPYSRDFDPERLLVDNYIPFNTLLIERGLFAEVGPFDRDLAFFEDWDFLVRLAGEVPFHHLRQVTCEYRHFRGAGHHVLGERPLERDDFLAMKARVLRKHARRRTPEVLARIINGLRTEAVESGEEIDRLRGVLIGTHSETVMAEERFHRANGELHAAKGDVDRLRGEIGQLDAAAQELRQAIRAQDAEVRRLHGEEQRLHAESSHLSAQAEERRQEADLLRAELEKRDTELRRLYEESGALRVTVESQTAHLGRVYAEIERLQAGIHAMRATRAWRLHEWWLRTVR